MITGLSVRMDLINIFETEVLPFMMTTMSHQE
jgi:hypothetical protein